MSALTDRDAHFVSCPKEAGRGGVQIAPGPCFETVTRRDTRATGFGPTFGESRTAINVVTMAIERIPDAAKEPARFLSMRDEVRALEGLVGELRHLHADIPRLRDRAVDAGKVLWDHLQTGAQREEAPHLDEVQNAAHQLLVATAGMRRTAAALLAMTGTSHSTDR